MAVVLRLSIHGKKGQPFYRVVAAEKENKRDGRYLEIIGTHNSMTNPPTTTLKEDLVKKWIAVGARPTQHVSDLIRKQCPGLLEGIIEHRTKKTQERRKARKQRNAKAKSKSK